MYLINTQTYELENVGSRDMYKEYAILSRTWEDGEATFEDMKDLDTARSRLGWHKIQRTCELASAEDLRYAWVDTLLH